MRHKKIHSFLMLLAMILLITTVAYAADPLTITTNRLPSAELGKEYSVQLTANGGDNSKYTFFIQRGALPDGLNLTEDGLLYGVPTQGGMFGGIYFGVRDAENNVATKRIVVRINSKTVNFTVANDRQEYDGSPHIATLVPSTRDITSEDYIVTYGGEESQTNIGAYEIRVQGVHLQEKGYQVGSISPGYMVITANSSSTISLSSQTFEYDGNPHQLNPPVVEPAAIANDYTVTYTGFRDTVYPETTQAPSDVGTYRVIATTTNPNYVTRTATAYLTITAPRVSFTVTDTSADYDGQPHQATVSQDTAGYDGGYTVTYDDLSTDEVETLDAATDAGQYRINIALNDPNHQVGTMTANTFTVRPREIDFTVSDNDVPYQVGVNNYSATITPSIEGFTDYTVTYVKDDDEYTGNVTGAGIYEIRIALDDTNNAKTSRNNVLGDISSQTFTVRKNSVDFTVTNNDVIFDINPESTGQAATVVPSIEGFTDYKVIYVDGNNQRHENKVTDIGTYSIEIEFTGDYSANYEVGNINDRTFTVRKIRVDFAVTNNNVSYNPDLEEQSYAVTVTPGIEGFTDYKVIYIDEDNHRNEDKVTDVGAYTIEIEFTGDYADKYEVGNIDENTFVVNPLTVNFTVGRESVDFDPAGTEGYDADITPSVPGFLDYNVKYVAANGDESTGKVDAVGEYTIRVELTATAGNHYRLGTVSAETFIVNPYTVNFTVTENEVAYEPGKQSYAAIVAAVNPEGFSDFKVMYVDENGEVQENSVDGVGEYTLQIAFTGENAGNYKVGTITPNIFKVTPKVVDFIVTENEVSYDPQIAEYNANVTALDIANFTDYTVVYVKDGVEYDEGKVTDAGEYEITIRLSEAVSANYQVGTVSPAKFTVTPCPVDFAISKNIVEYNPDKTSYAAVITPSVDGFKKYNVTYTKEGGEPWSNEIIAADNTVIGSYEIAIGVTDSNYILGNISGGNTFTINSPSAQIVLNRGNSPAAMIGDDEVAQAAFKENHVYNGVTYNPVAWGDTAGEGYKNHDEDKEAYFIIDRNVNMNDLGCYATYSDGREVNPEDIAITVEGENVDAWLAKAHANGVYEMVYSFMENGDPFTVSRKLIVLNRMGDTNSDRNINAGDARYLQSVVLNDLESQTPVYLYRVCDVNHDGVVDDKDAEAIMNRMNVPLVSYYPLSK